MNYDKTLIYIRLTVDSMLCSIDTGHESVYSLDARQCLLLEPAGCRHLDLKPRYGLDIHQSSIVNVLNVGDIIIIYTDVAAGFNFIAEISNQFNRNVIQGVHFY